MTASTVLDELTCPVLPAPMAGGPTTPALVAAAAKAGSLGTLAWGTASREQAEAQLEQLLDTGTTRWAVNLFHPQQPLREQERQAALAVAAAEGVELAAADYSFGWDAKLDLALGVSTPPRVVWAMFGPFSGAEIARIHGRGTEAWVTVTNPAEAHAAAEAGADVLCVQGPDAGGHRGIWDEYAEPDQRALPDLVRACQVGLPLLAAGGLRTAEDVARVLGLPGVAAAVCGSAFLLADEAGTSPANREMLSKGGPTVSTRAFSGRVARGLATEYIAQHPDAPAIYPHLNQILRSRRAAGDKAVAYCLVGEPATGLGGGRVEDILRRLNQKAN
ncbi:nitronate monooxygenase [Corynebacterium sp. LK2514]|uniref:nitronate monooxygenase n=1 Tax=Corynebacterium sp. LK2514 TaxID=3110473 RepID=UPI0034CE973D